MNVFPPCFSCILDVRFKEILNSVKDNDKSIRIQHNLLKIANEEFNNSNELTHIASRMYLRLVKEAPEIINYYKEVKRKSIDLAVEEIHGIEEYLEKLQGYERFKYAVKVSIAGNLLDQGVSQFKPPETVTPDLIEKMEFGIDDTKRAYEFLKSKRILYLFDNAGEALYDTVLIRVLKELNNEVIGVAKEEPGFQNDLTIDDAKYAGIDKVVKVITTGYSGSSIHLEEISNSFREELELSDVIISKGMANFEYINFINFSKPIFFLLVPKCDPVSLVVRAKKGSLVALLKN